MSDQQYRTEGNISGLVVPLNSQIIGQLGGVERVKAMVNVGGATVIPLSADVLRIMGGEERLKAVMMAGGADGINAQGAVPENLEMTAHVYLWRREHLQFMRMIPNVPAASINHEYDVVTSYGDVGGPIFTAEGTLGSKESLRVERHVNRIVTLQHVNQVTGTAQDQKTVSILGATRALESNREGVMRLHLLKKSVATIFADTSTTASELRFKGVLQLWREKRSSADFADEPWSIDADVFVDRRGGPLRRSDVRSAGTRMFEEAWGQGNLLVMDPQTSEGFQGEIEKIGSNGAVMERIDASKVNEGIILGTTIAGIQHQGGVAKFVVDNTLHPSFHKAEWKGQPAVGAPSQPAVPTVTVLNANANSRWEAADLNGANAVIKYKIQAVNDQGYSESSAATAAIDGLDAGDSVRITITTRADAHSYRILRNTAEKPNVFWEVAEIKNTAATVTHDDHNYFLPGGRWALFLEMLAPRSKENRLGANPYDNAIRYATLRELTARKMADIGDFEWERLIERFCPEVPQPFRVIVYYNIGTRGL